VPIGARANGKKYPTDDAKMLFPAAAHVAGAQEFAQRNGRIAEGGVRTGIEDDIALILGFQDGGV
jgi:hypothetical protein